jgi:hypothetical protein
MPKKASGNFLTLKKLVQQFVKNNVYPLASKGSKATKPWATRQPAVRFKESEHRFWSDRYMYRSEGEKEEPIFSA